MLWHVSDLIGEGSAVLSFASQDIDTDGMYPIEIRFDETYSLIDLAVDSVSNAASGEGMSLKVLQSLSTENYKITGD